MENEKNVMVASGIFAKELGVGNELQFDVYRYFVDDDIKSICEIITKQNYFPNTAIIMKALTAYNPSAAKDWLPVLMAPLDETLANLRTSPEYVLGFVLGIFESVVWLDSRYFKDCGKEDEPFKKVIMHFVDLLLFQNHWVRQVDKLFPNPKFEGRLSNAVKAFIRGNKEAQGNRYDFVVCFVKKVLEKHKIKRNDKDDVFKNLSTIGRIILDQFNFPLLTEMSTPIGRAQMIYDHFKNECKC